MTKNGHYQYYVTIRKHRTTRARLKTQCLAQSNAMDTDLS